MGRLISSPNVLEGIISSGMYSNGLMVKYIGNNYYFNYPTTNWNGTIIHAGDESFQYYVQSDDGEVSKIVKKFITVQNVNDPTNITFVPPKGWVGIVYAIGASTSSQYPTSIKFSGFSLIDRDLGVDVIKAEISSAMNGRLSINPNSLKQLDFNSDKYCFGSKVWQCQGDGISNSNMIFVAAPSVIESAINGMTYQSLTQNVVDNVTITLYDGAVSTSLL